jgi:metal-dependent amidase/aminoacylase/carboxypeptidase family protein
VGDDAARPHEAADPIVAGGAFIGALQTLVSR